MLRSIPLAILLALGLVLPAGAEPRHVGRALPVVVQDDAQLIFHDENRVRASMRQLKKLGVDWVRLTASWSELTHDATSPRRPSFDATNPAAYDQGRWKSLDQAVVLAREQGLKVMIDIGFWAPRWATTDPAGPRARTYINPQEFRAFGLAVVRRYGGGFVPGEPGAVPEEPAPPPPSEDPSLQEQIFGSEPDPAPPAPAPDPAPQAAPKPPLPKVSTFLLWNEPNHPAFLMPQWRTEEGGKTIPISPHLYRTMVEAAYPAIKAVRGDTRVLVGNTSSIGGREGSGAIAPLRFLRALACVNRHMKPVDAGECETFTAVPGDGWAQHPYALDVAPSTKSSRGDRDDVRVADLPRLAKMLDRLVRMGRLAPRMRAIYVTEFGYETQPIRGRPNLTEGMQARYLTQSEWIASRVPQVKMFGQFLLRDVPPAATAQTGSPRRAHGQFSTGLQHADGRSKLAMRSFVAGLYAQRVSRRTVLLWGRLRLGSAARTVRLQRQVGPRRWETVATSEQPRGRLLQDFSAVGMGAFLRYVTDTAGSRYRLVYREGRAWVTGLPVPVVR
jgi:hypothetical protein